MMSDDRGPDFTPENEAADERRMFDGAKEPMRALRDLINACELYFHDAPAEQETLRRAQDGFTALRKLFGDNRPGEEIADAVMIEPTAAMLTFLGPISLADLERLKAGPLGIIEPLPGG